MPKQKYTTTEIENQKGRIEYLEEVLSRIDVYLDNHLVIMRDSTAHRDIKLTLGKIQYGDIVYYSIPYSKLP